MLKNNKGWVPMVIVVAMAFIALPFMTPRFRRQSAVRVCMEGGTSEGACKIYVKTLSKQEIYDYIQDNKVAVELDNHGNL